MKYNQSLLSLLLLVALIAVSTPRIEAQTPLTTTFANNNGSTGNMFDVKSLTGVIINDFDINTSVAIGDFEVWALTMPNVSYINHRMSNASWTLLGTATGVVGAGAGNPTPLGLNLNFPIFPGDTQAFYVTGINGAGVNYTTGVGATGALYASNTDLEYYQGHGGSYFNLTFNPRIWNGNIHYTNQMLFTDDLATTKIVSPANDPLSCAAKTSTEVVSFEFRNFGTTTVPSGTVITVSFSVDGGPLTFEFFPLAAPLALGETASYTFTATADLSAIGPHTVTCTASGLIDLDLSNDSLTETIYSGGETRIVLFPYSEDFTVTGANGSTTAPAGYVQETTEATGTNSDWLFRNDATPTFNTGPTEDHTTGVAGSGGYAYIDDNSSHAAINLRSPCFDLLGAFNPTLRFFIYSNSATGPTQQNLFSIDVISQPSGLITTDVFGPQGHIGPNWTLQTLSLNAFAGQTIQLVLRGETTNSGSTDHDIAIDDISVLELLATPGQAPQPGLAVLDINDPRNINTDPLTFGFGGPFFTNVTEGDILRFKMEGEALQPIILFSGPLNPNAASFPNVGSIDLGGPIDPVSGLPTALTVLADGTVLGGLNSFFVTAANGIAEIGFSVPNLPIGVLGSFQCAFFTTGGAGVALSNAVQVTVM